MSRTVTAEQLLADALVGKDLRWFAQHQRHASEHWVTIKRVTLRDDGFVMYCSNGVTARGIESFQIRDPQEAGDV